MISLWNFGEGIITAALTPLTSSGEVMEESIAEFIDFQIRSGIKGFFVLGTYGEGLAIHPRKRMYFLERFLNYVRDNTLIIVNVSSTAPELSLELAKHATDLGVSAISSLPPIYYAQDLGGLVKYFSLFSKIDSPVLIYNNPQRQNYDITPSIFEHLVNEVPNLKGIKDSSGSIERVHKLLNTSYVRNYFIAIANDLMVLHTFLLGGKAHICGLSNLFPEISHKIYTSVINNDLKLAIELQNILNSVREAVKEIPVDSSVVVRELMKLRGIDLGHPSPINRELTQNEKTKVVSRVKSIIHKSSAVLEKAGINIGDLLKLTP
ncbi:MAG: dihydrodipicolinate synthase family protein [Zestosphaera sp.]